MRKTMTQMQLANVFDNTVEILRRLQTADPDVARAEVFVDQNGGPDAVRMVWHNLSRLDFTAADVARMQNPELVEQVAAILHEKATVGMKDTLRQGFDDLLEKHTYVSPACVALLPI